jgi:DNA repair protein RadC
VKNSFTIHDLPVEERPRERLQKIGVENLSVHEILALILGRGIAGESVMDTAQSLIRKFGSLRGIANASLEELRQVKGIGLAKAAQIKAACELANRLNRDERNDIPVERPLVKTPDEAFNTVKDLLQNKKKEHFMVLLVDTRSRLIKSSEVSIGSLDSSIAHPREVFQDAIAANAASVVLAHNHPSGNPEPSADDIKLTKRLVEAGNVVGIEVLDHIIIGNKKSDKLFFSLKREGLF